MAFLTQSSSSSSSKKQKPTKKQEKVKPPSSWDQIKNLLTCKQIQRPRVHDPIKIAHNTRVGSTCSFKDVVHANTRVVHRPDDSPENSSLRRRKPASAGGGVQLRKLSGCYECRTIVDPGRYSNMERTCSCSQCGEVFTKLESLELHQAFLHAVTELDPEDSGRNIVEIIFKSSWLKKDGPIFMIERILKIHNTQRTIQRFENCRDAVKTRAVANPRKNPRCAADGNELLRFHCTTISCSLGACGSSGLCGSVPGGGVCTVIRRGFQVIHAPKQRVRTAVSSGRAHDSVSCGGGRRAMLVCRVIAGRVKHVAGDVAEVEATTSYDSVAGYDLEDLIVFNPKAILPCFVVVYKTIIK